MTQDAWFEMCDPGDATAAARAIHEGETDAPEDWPARAVADGVFDSLDAYYDALHAATVTAAREEATERERADDQQLVHAVRAMDDCARTANELAERTSEWAGGRFGVEGGGVEFARDIAQREPDSPGDERVVALAERVVDLDAEAEVLRTFVERTTPAVAPNLAEMAGSVLAARLISLAGGLEALAKQPSGTVQVLGAEEALFAHLRGHASSPKHGVIYTHEYVRGTHPDERGSAARALAGKLAIAARIDHYSGDRRASVHEDLADRMATIRARTDDDSETRPTDGGEGS